MTRDHDEKSRQGSNGSRRPAQIRAEIMRTRGEMDHTLEAIEHRLTPGQLVDQGLDYLKNSGARQYATNLGASLKTHPLPATLTGIGLAWLMAVGNKVEQPDADTGPSVGDRMGEVKERVGEAKGRLGDTAREQMDRAREQMDRARGNWEYMMREHPLALGAVGLALGAVAAAMAPRTQKEDELMGEARDRLLDQAKATGRDKIEQAASAVAPMKETPQKASEGQSTSAAEVIPEWKPV